LSPPQNNSSENISLATKNAIRAAKFRAIRTELAQVRRTRRPNEVSLDSITWMARSGELLGPSPTPVDDPALSSRLYGPAMKTVQLERVEVNELDEHGRVIWSA
jgi:hypothetical protein